MAYCLVQEQLSAGSSLSLSQMCRVLGVRRDGYYRWLGAAASASDADTPREDVEVRDQIQRIALEMTCYGYRTMTRELRRRGYIVNHKRVLRLLREDNLLCLRRRSFRVTTDSNHSFAVYPNLVPQLVVDDINQLWVADITYIHLAQEFIYLAVVLDAFSRRCIGWALEPYLDARLTLAALRMALAARSIAPGLVHHSDRGVQYACGDYTRLLQEHGIVISMSRRGNPYDNAKAESFIKTLKYEEVYLNEYETMSQAHHNIGEFLDAVYNEKRLHSSLDYVPPAEFEAALSDNGH